MSTDELNEYEVTYIQLVMIWKIDRFKRFLMTTHLIEHGRSHVWNRDMLMKLNEETVPFNIQHSSTEET
jgi:hypothetical protein